MIVCSISLIRYLGTSPPQDIDNPKDDVYLLTRLIISCLFRALYIHSEILSAASTTLLDMISTK